jgi:uncharacterized iron-regulated membrane protein
MRLLIILHRYLGVAVGLLMVLWCLSGFVMMYQGYPSLDQGARLRGLQPLRLTPAQARAAIDVPDDATLTGFRIEMAADRPVMHVTRGPGRRQVFDLGAGRPLDMLPASQALTVAEGFAASNGVAGRPADAGLIDVDQWTLDGINRAGPMHHIRFNDPAGTQLYVAGRTGEAVQLTTARTRLLSWLGAVPHWLYPTLIRNNPPLWDAVVVWTSLAGVFLTGFGLYLGIARFKRYKSGRWSPYRGWFYWHHIIGLVFGLLTLTWVASGLLSMGPWGLLESSVGLAERARLSGTITGADAKAFLALAPAVAQGDVAQLQAAPFGGRLFVLATDRAGRVTRLDSDGRPTPLTQADVAQGLGKALGGRPIAALERLDHEDAYYYDSYDGKAALPVFRARLADAQHTTFYVDASSGRMVRAVDNTARQSRWLRTGLHDFDFGALRARPLWDIVVLLMLAGVTGTCVTGAWLAIKCVIRDVRSLRGRAAAKSS